MYSQHQPLIAKHASTPDGLCDVQLLAILSARMPFYRVFDDFKAVKRGDDRPLFSWKYEAYRQAVANAEHRFVLLRHALEQKPGDLARDPADRALALVSQYFGLGFIKGGFVLQMAYGVSGCIDTRNADTYGIQNHDTRAPDANASVKARFKRAQAYNALVRGLGGTERLWDAWCNYYADSGDNPDWVDGWSVSAEHCRILDIDPGERPIVEEIPW